MIAGLLVTLYLFSYFLKDYSLLQRTYKDDDDDDDDDDDGEDDNDNSNNLSKLISFIRR